MRPWAAFATCVAVWGGSWIAIRAAVAGADPFAVAALRATFAVPLLALVALGLRLPLPGVRQAAQAMLVGTVLIGANFAVVYAAAPHLPSGLAAILYATAPLQAALLAPLAGRRDRPTLRTVGAAALGGVGVALAFGGTGWSAAPWWACAGILLGATTSAAGTALARRWPGPHPVWTNAFANLAAGAMLWPLAAAGDLPLAPQGGGAWAGFAYMLLGGSVLAFLCYFDLVRAWDAARASFTTLATPFVALALGALLLGEPVGWAQALGAAVVLAAGWLLLLRRAEIAPPAWPPQGADPAQAGWRLG